MVGPLAGQLGATPGNSDLAVLPNPSSRTRPGAGAATWPVAGDCQPHYLLRLSLVGEGAPATVDTSNDE